MNRLVGYCVTCNEIRYRGKVDFAPGIILKPEDFESVGAQPPADPKGQPTCYNCGATLKFLREAQLESLKDPKRIEPKPFAVTTLFEAKPDESIIDIVDVQGSILVKTTKRILVIDLSSIGAFNVV